MDALLILLIVLVAVAAVFVLWYAWYRRNQAQWDEHRKNIKSVPLHDLRHALLCFGALLAGLGFSWWFWQISLPKEQQSLYLQMILFASFSSALFCTISMLLGRHHYLIGLTTRR